MKIKIKEGTDRISPEFWGRVYDVVTVKYADHINGTREAIWYEVGIGNNACRFTTAVADVIEEDEVPSSWPGERLRHMASIFDERNALYGDNYKHFGTVMLGIFPDGLELKTADDWNRIGVFVQMMAKATRYGQMFIRGGHVDSLDDSGVYGTMLNQLDFDIAVRDGKSTKAWDK